MTASGSAAMSSCYFIAAPGRRNAPHLQMVGLARELTARGHRVVLILDGQQPLGWIAEEGMTVLSWPSRRPTKPRDAIFLAGAIRRHRPRAIMACFGAVNVSIVVGWLFRVTCRVAWHRTLSAAVTYDALRSSAMFWLLRLRKRGVFGLASHVVANSEAGARDVREMFHVPERKIAVLANGMTDPAAGGADMSSDQDSKKLVCAGRLHPTKGQDVLLRALPRIVERMPGVHVHFIGDGPSKRELLDLAARLGVTDACHFDGSLGRETVLKEMASSVATIVPSRSDAFPWVNIESMAVGTPVVASAVGGIVDIVQDGVNGFLFEDDNPDQLARKVLAVMSDPKLRGRLSERARALFLERYELGSVARTQVDWLEWASDDSQPQPVG